MNQSAKKISLAALVVVILMYLNPGYSHEQDSGSMQVRITTDPWKSLIICSRDVWVVEGAVLLPSEEELPGVPVSNTIVTTGSQALLQLSFAYPCTKEQTRHHPYQAKKVIHSEWPFLAEFSPTNKNKKRARSSSLAEGGWLLPFDSVKQHGMSGYGGGSPGSDDHQHRRPYGFFPEGSGDIDLFLLGGFELPQVMGDDLPDYTAWQAGLNLLSMGNEQSHTLWVYPGDQPVPLASIQVSSSEMVEMVTSLGKKSGEEKLAWLRQKLRPNQRQALFHQLLALQDFYSADDAVLSGPVLELIRDRLIEVFDKTNAEIDLEFEFFRLHRDLAKLAGEITESLVLAHRPDTSIVYEGSEVEKLIHQAGQTTSRSSQAGGGGGQGVAEGNDGNRQGGRGVQDVPGQAGDNPGSGAEPQGQEPEEGIPWAPPVLTITFIGATNTGKSSLANRFIGFPYFTVNDRPVRKESDYYFCGLKIRSLPGFPDTDARTYIQDHGIGRAELVVFVLDGDLTEGVITGMVSALKKNGNEIIFVRNKIDTVVGDPQAFQRMYRERFGQKMAAMGVSGTPLIFTSTNLLEKDRAASVDELENHLYVFLTGYPFRCRTAQVTPVTGLWDHFYSFLASRRFQVFLEFQKSRLRIRHCLAREIVAKGVLEIMGKNLESPGASGDRAFFINAIREAITNTHPFLANYDISITLNESQREFLESIMEDIDRIFRGEPEEEFEEEPGQRVTEEDIRFYLKTCSSIVLKKHQGYSKGCAAVVFSPLGISLGAMFGAFLGKGFAHWVNYMLLGTVPDLATDLSEQGDLVRKKIMEERDRDILSLNENRLSEEESKRREVIIRGAAATRAIGFSAWVFTVGTRIHNAEESLKRLIESILSRLQEQLDRGRLLSFSGRNTLGQDSLLSSDRERIRPLPVRLVPSFPRPPAPSEPPPPEPVYQEPTGLKMRSNIISEYGDNSDTREKARQLSQALNFQIQSSHLGNDEKRQLEDSAAIWASSCNRYGVEKIIVAMCSYCELVLAGETPDSAHTTLTAWLEGLVIPTTSRASQPDLQEEAAAGGSGEPGEL